jgi:hypothetical protein
MLAKERFDRAYDPELAADFYAVADLERLLAAEMPGRDDLVAAPQLEAIVETRHRRRGRYAFALPSFQQVAVAARADAQPPCSICGGPCWRAERPGASRDPSHEHRNRRAWLDGRFGQGSASTPSRIWKS